MFHPPDYRIPHGMTTAERARRQFPKPKPSNPAAKRGLAYEAKVGKELLRHTEKGNFSHYEHNPWFTFYDEHGVGNCCPDFILYLDQGVVVVEVKLTWVEQALNKLMELYCPVVGVAIGLPVRPLVICHNLTPLAPVGVVRLSDAIRNPRQPLLWPQNGRMIW